MIGRFKKHAHYSRRKNNCRKIQPAQFMITKRDFISRGRCFCEKYSYRYARGPTKTA